MWRRLQYAIIAVGLTYTAGGCGESDRVDPPRGRTFVKDGVE
jgi:hypothetical protein